MPSSPQGTFLTTFANCPCWSDRNCEKVHFCSFLLCVFGRVRTGTKKERIKTKNSHRKRTTRALRLLGLCQVHSHTVQVLTVIISRRHSHKINHVSAVRSQAVKASVVIHSVLTPRSHRDASPATLEDSILALYCARLMQGGFPHAMKP